MWAELAETGWDAIIAWSAGAQNLGRLLSSDAGRTVSVVCTRGGVAERFEESFTEKDRQMVDDDVNEYLAAAEIPSRPQGYRWFLRVPSAYHSADAFLRDVHAAVVTAESGGPGHPAQLRPIVETVVQRFYT
ncbi:DUF5956 family protein [Arthrobacter sp. Leaf141]|uniref:DUF5956 family protein n=1 Tax=Arthrobacter sp. Leaf141 TaxID=1736273 RepID=UPI001F168D7B|nr:DUF5956 family protein [Arthrobacter sp. Leaf141]